MEKIVIYRGKAYLLELGVTECLNPLCAFGSLEHECLDKFKEFIIEQLDPEQYAKLKLGLNGWACNKVKLSPLS